MDAIAASEPTRKQTAVFLWVTAAAGLAALAVWLFVPDKFVKLAAIGSAGAAFALLVFCFPRHGFYFGYFWVFAGLSYYGGGPVAAVVSLLVTMGVLTELLRGGTIEFRDPLFNWAMAFFVAFSIQSLLFAYDPWYTIGGLLSFAKTILTVFLICQLTRTEKHLETLAFVVFAAVLSTVILGVVNVRLGIVKDWTVISSALSWMRFGSTHVNPNLAAYYLVVGLPLAIYAVTRARGGLAKGALVAAILAIIVATVMTFSRQAIFPLVVILVATLIKQARRKYVYGIVATAVVVVALFVPQYYWWRISTIGSIFSDSAGDFSLRIRLKALQAGWHLFLQHPFTGIGLNNFYVRSGSAELPVKMVAHNGYLEVLCGVGIFGFIAYLLMPVAGLRGLLRAWKAPWPEDRRWMKGLSFYLLLSLVAALVGVFFQHLHFYRIFWFPVAAGLVAGQLADKARIAAKKSET
jgi:putative inorganic carbon (HCO3(-)) transporter